MISNTGQAGAQLPPAAIICTACGHPLYISRTQDPLATVGSAGTGVPESCNLAPGTLLAGRYRITALIGNGGMGEVYQADDVTLEEVVAIKFLPPHLQSDRDALTRFHREVSLARRISHPNVCRVFDIGYAEGLAFITMEYVAGDNLRELLERIGPLPCGKALEVARQLCSGLAAAHDEGVLHRDLKPANIMLDRRGHVRITDFGLAAPLEEHEFSAMGTPVYMAPEQVRGQHASVRTDLYSLGLVLHEVFTGEPVPLAVAFHVEGLAPAGGGLPPAIERVILQCLEGDPAKRPKSAAEVAEVLAGAGTSEIRESAARGGFDPRKGFGWLVFLAALLGLAVFLIMAMHSAVEFGVFDHRASSSRAVLFTWVWCLAAQSFLVFLSLAYLLKRYVPAGR